MMRRSWAVPTLLALVLSLNGCGGHRTADQQADQSTVPNRACNPALGTNPSFLNTNEGIQGAGGPDLPGIGGASGKCRGK